MENNKNGGVYIPKWGLATLGVIWALIVVGGIPWSTAMWNSIHKMEKQLATMNVRLGRQDEILGDIKDLREMEQAHMNDPTIHHSAINRIEYRLDRIEQALP